MSKPDGVPIIFGVTGHRDLRPEDEPVLSAAVRGIFERFCERYPSTQLVLVTALAAGADCLVARVANSMQIPFRAVLPFDAAEYRNDFSADAAAEFDRLLELATASVTLPVEGGVASLADPARRARAYEKVGAHVASVSHVLIALWNGKASEHVGATANVVDFRLQGASPADLPSGSLLDAKSANIVYQIVTPRLSDPVVESRAGRLIVKTAHGEIDESRDPSNAFFERFEAFNRGLPDAQASAAGPSLLRVRDAAEVQATRYQRLSRWMQAFVFLSTTFAALILAFSHVTSDKAPLAFGYASLLGLALIGFFIADRSHWKERAIECRALELGLNVQRVWDLADVRTAAADSYLRIMHNELDWIRKAVRSVHYLATEETADEKLAIVAVRDFVVGQRDFFRGAYRRDRRWFLAFATLTKCFFYCSLAASVTLFCIALSRPLARGPFEWTVFAILISTILTAACHEYPRQRAFQAQARRYSGIWGIYDRAAEVLDANREASLQDRLRIARDVIGEVGREALAENGEWLLMHRELPIEPPDV